MRPTLPLSAISRPLGYRSAPRKCRMNQRFCTVAEETRRDDVRRVAMFDGFVQPVGDLNICARTPGQRLDTGAPILSSAPLAQKALLLLGTRARSRARTAVNVHRRRGFEVPGRLAELVCWPCPPIRGQCADWAAPAGGADRRMRAVSPAKLRPAFPMGSLRCGRFRAVTGPSWRVGQDGPSNKVPLALGRSSAIPVRSNGRGIHGTWEATARVRCRARAAVRRSPRGQGR